MTMNDTGTRVEISPDGSNRKRLIQLPKVLGHNKCAATTDIKCPSNFKGMVFRTVKIHEQLDRNANFLPARERCVSQRRSFGPGGPTRESYSCDP